MPKKRWKKTKPGWTDASGNRTWSDPRYKKWSKDVKKRDGYKCRWPLCKETKCLQTHHIKSWAKYPLGRFSVNNGITLCKQHHKLVFRKEEQYAAIFLRILSQHKLEPPRE